MRYSECSEVTLLRAQTLSPHSSCMHHLRFIIIFIYFFYIGRHLWLFWLLVTAMAYSLMTVVPPHRPTTSLPQQLITSPPHHVTSSLSHHLTTSPLTRQRGSHPIHYASIGPVIPQSLRPAPRWLTCNLRLPDLWPVDCLTWNLRFSRHIASSSLTCSVPDIT